MRCFCFEFVEQLCSSCIYCSTACCYLDICKRVNCVVRVNEYCQNVVMQLIKLQFCYYQNHSVQFHPLEFKILHLVHSFLQKTLMSGTICIAFLQYLFVSSLVLMELYWTLTRNISKHLFGTTSTGLYTFCSGICI